MAKIYNWNIARNGKVYVMEKCCATCPYRGHIEHYMKTIQVNIKNDNVLPCHETTDGPDQAICRGYYDKERDKVPIMQVAQRLGVVAWQALPTNQD